MGAVVRPSAILFEQSKQTEPCESLKQAGNGLYRDCQSLNVNQQRGGPHPDLKQGFDLSALSASKGGVQSAPIGTPPQRYLRYYEVFAVLCSKRQHPKLEAELEAARIPREREGIG
jgi:hypothetical protein